MIKFLDALYLVCSDFYKKREREIYKISGMLLLTSVLLFNLISVSIVLSDNRIGFLKQSAVHSMRYYVVFLGMLVTISLLYLRYFRLTNYDEVSEKFKSMSNPVKSIYYLGAVAYVVSSFLAGLFLAANAYYKWL